MMISRMYSLRVSVTRIKNRTLSGFSRKNILDAERRLLHCSMVQCFAVTTKFSQDQVVFRDPRCVPQHEWSLGMQHLWCSLAGFFRKVFRHVEQWFLQTASALKSILFASSLLSLPPSARCPPSDAFLRVSVLRTLSFVQTHRLSQHPNAERTRLILQSTLNSFVPVQLPSTSALEQLLDSVQVRCAAPQVNGNDTLQFPLVGISARPQKYTVDTVRNTNISCVSSYTLSLLQHVNSQAEKVSDFHEKRVRTISLVMSGSVI